MNMPHTLGAEHVPTFKMLTKVKHGEDGIRVSPYKSITNRMTSAVDEITQINASSACNEANSISCIEKTNA